MFGGLLGSIWHRIKWLAIFILVIFGYLAVTNPSGISGAATTIGNILGSVAGGLLTIIQAVVHGLQNSGLKLPGHH